MLAISEIYIQVNNNKYVVLIHYLHNILFRSHFIMLFEQLKRQHAISNTKTCVINVCSKPEVWR